MANYPHAEPLKPFHKLGMQQMGKDDAPVESLCRIEGKYVGDRVYIVVPMKTAKREDLVKRLLKEHKQEGFDGTAEVKVVNEDTFEADSVASDEALRELMVNARRDYPNNYFRVILELTKKKGK